MHDIHREIMNWFTRRYGQPTDIQKKVWPVVSRDEHVLIDSPTGTGKTLAAFLCTLDRYARGRYIPGELRTLYISPIKALNNDIKRNLLDPISGLNSSCPGLLPDIRVDIRSGDTPQSERRRTLKRPPEILVTTPESLNILLATKSGVGLLRTVSCVILDEIHYVFADKRGVHLITAIERLANIAGEFQRIGMSATAENVVSATEFLGGYQLVGENTFQKRKVKIVTSEDRPRYEI